jgi:hypothetical protein
MGYGSGERFGHWLLKFGIYLLFGSWILEFKY